jgi:hypothetical protein
MRSILKNLYEGDRQMSDSEIVLTAIPTAVGEPSSTEALNPVDKVTETDVPYPFSDCAHFRASFTSLVLKTL